MVTVLQAGGRHLGILTRPSTACPPETWRTRWRWPCRVAWLSVGLLPLVGCAALTHTHPHELPGPPSVAQVLQDGYRDYAGVIHVHTTYSHDAQGTFDGVVRAANAQGLDYVIVTEHNNLRPLREGKQGWYGTTLVLVGTEVSTRAGHYLALNVTQDIDRSHLSPQQIIDEVNRQGGLGFIAHPYCKGAWWKDWSVHGMTGIEIYNVAHDTLDSNWRRLLLWTLTAPAEPFYRSLVHRPYDPLAAWDRLIHRDGKMVGIGSTDAHEFHVFGFTLAPYRDLFQVVRTHVLIPASSTRLTPEAVYDALRHGHAYVAIELVGEAKGFTFMADDGQHVLGIMGDTVPFTAGLQLTMVLPSTADMTLFKDGEPLQAKTGYLWQVPITTPGVYRVEAMYYGKPWLFSNPIYITPAPTRTDVPESLRSPRQGEPSSN